MEKDYVYVIGIAENKEKSSLIMTKQDKEGNKEVVLEVKGKNANIWLDFFFKLNEGQAQVIVDRE